jgi:lipid-A-disaccharide synthase
MARILVSAGEASSDLYASLLVEALRRRRPDLTFAGCAGQVRRFVACRGSGGSAVCALREKGN